MAIYLIPLLIPPEYSENTGRILGESWENTRRCDFANEIRIFTIYIALSPRFPTIWKKL
jgi:hypothetical protein